MASRLVRSLCAVGITLVLWQCGGSDGPTGMSQPTLQKAASANGDSQTGQVATALSLPLRVVVMLDGSPQQGTSVSWGAGSGNGSVAPASSVTDASGIATTTWTLGQTAGSQTATASVSGATGSPLSFTATATAGPATQLALSDGNDQTGTPNSTLAGPLEVKAGDQFGNGVQGVGVTWQVTSGTATVDPTNSDSDAGGLAQTAVMLGSDVGQVTITATSGTLTGSPVTFHADIATLPTTAAVNVGGNFFKSARNDTSNPAVDTVAVGGTVTWTWTGAIDHGVQSTGSPSFTNSATMTSGTYSFTFTTAGTYSYDCTVHGASMTGRVVVK